VKQVLTEINPNPKLDQAIHDFLKNPPRFLLRFTKTLYQHTIFHSHTDDENNDSFPYFRIYKSVLKNDKNNDKEITKYLARYNAAKYKSNSVKYVEYQVGEPKLAETIRKESEDNGVVVNFLLACSEKYIQYCLSDDCPTYVVGLDILGNELRRNVNTTYSLVLKNMDQLKGKKIGIRIHLRERIKYLCFPGLFLLILCKKTVIK